MPSLDPFTTTKKLAQEIKQKYKGRALLFSAVIESVIDLGINRV